jgi:hypothetical protein
MPLSSKLIRTNMPTVHGELDGQRKEDEADSQRRNHTIDEGPDRSVEPSTARKRASSRFLNQGVRG